MCGSNNRFVFMMRKMGVVLLFLQRDYGNIEEEIMTVEQSYWEEQNQTQKKELFKVLEMLGAGSEKVGKEKEKQNTKDGSFVEEVKSAKN